MGVVIPLGYVEDRASGALVVDGGLRFDRSKTNIVRKTFSSSGNRKTWTLSFWHKVTDTSNPYNIFTASRGSSTRPTFEIAHNYGSSGNLVLSQYNGSGYDIGVKVDGLYRDTNAWYHFVIVVDTTQSTDSNRVKVYVNGTQRTVTATAGGSVWPSLNADLEINNGVLHNISANAFGDGNPMNGYVCLMYMVDGQALDPSYFGYTDALTNTWRPKKLSSSVAFGTNGFYLPFDGSAPIGQDQSGRGNNWTPVNFGGSNTLEKATGALPILNTDGGGKVARVGVRTDSSASSLVLALPLVGIKSDFSNAVNSGTSNKVVTVVGGATASSSQSNFYSGSFYFDGNGDALTVSSVGSLSADFTIEAWIWCEDTSTSRTIFGPWVSPSVLNLRVNSSTAYLLEVSGVSLSPAFGGISKWHHVALCRSGSTLKFYEDGIERASTTFSGTLDLSTNDFRIGQEKSSSSTADIWKGYIQEVRVYTSAKYTSNFIPASTDPDIVPDSPSGVSYSSNVALVPSTDGAVAFDGSGDYLSLADSADFTMGSGDFTVECFVYNLDSGNRRFIIGQSDSSGQNVSISFSLYKTSGNKLEGTVCVGANFYNITSVNNLPTNSWVHCAFVRNGTSTYLYMNGILEASSGSVSTSSINDSSNQVAIGRLGEYNADYWLGFISNVQVVKGTALYTSNFTPPSAPISSVANTKLLCCKSNSSATAFDVSPGTITANGNAIATNFNPFTVNINTQRGKQSGYATLNPLAVVGGASYSNGNLKVTGSTAYRSTPSTIEMRVGKWYVEYFFDTWVNDSHVGVMNNISPSITGTWAGNTSNGFAWAGDSGDLWTGGVQYNSSFDVSFTTGDTCQIAFDADNGNMYFGKNGIWLKGANPSAGTGANWTGLTNGPYYPFVTTTNGTICSANFGQKPFKFPPPAGFQPLALANTPRPTIVRPDQFVGVTTYTGTGAVRSINTGFKPDFVWIKERGDTGGHVLYDTVRGATKHLASHSTNAEATDTDALTSFNNYGFSLGSGYTVVSVNGSTRTYVAWAWKAGGNSNTYNINDVGYATASAAGLTAGTITPTGASVNTKSGFSIITYTGPNDTSAHSFSHGLGKKPSFIIIKNRDSGFNWDIYHSSLGYNSSLIFTNDATRSGAYSAEPDSALVNVQWNYTTYQNQRYVAYCWAEIPGFSKFGSYTGGGSNYPYIQTGFSPALVIIKDASTGGTNYDWHIFDSERNPYNLGADNADSKNVLFANLNSAENKASSPWAQCDFLSNGFRVNDQSVTLNNSGSTYIYAAFAETPTQNLYGAQVNAR